MEDIRLGKRRDYGRLGTASKYRCLECGEFLGDINTFINHIKRAHIIDESVEESIKKANSKYYCYTCCERIVEEPSKHSCTKM